MTTLGDILTFVKLMGRINGTSEDTLLTSMVNYSYPRYAKRQLWPQLRTTATFTVDTTPTQSYNLAADFERMYDQGVRYDTATTGRLCILPLVSKGAAELWRAMQSTNTPGACQVIAGTSPVQKLQLLPTFTETGKVVSYDYQKNPAALTSSGDILEVPALADAICWDVLEMYLMWLRDDSGVAKDYAARAKRAYYDATASMIQQ